MWIRCKYEEDEVGMYLTPLIGYSNRGGDKSFWIGWLWWLWTFRLTKRAADGGVRGAIFVMSNMKTLSGCCRKSNSAAANAKPLGGTW